MGTRNATVRQLAFLDLTTTILTLALTGLAGDSSLTGGHNVRWGRRIARVLAIVLGAAVGAVLVISVGLAVPLTLAAVVILLVTIVYVARPASKI
jgi:uncharacterized membrane protein YoaK (UPF0700 family)